MGKRRAESTFVHFRQLFQEGDMGLPSLDITGIDEHTTTMRTEEARRDTLSICLVFMRLYEGRPDFGESSNAHFRQLMRERRIYPWGLTRLP